MQMTFLDSQNSQVGITLAATESFSHHSGPCVIYCPAAGTSPESLALAAAIKAGAVVAPFVAPPPPVPQQVMMWGLQAVLTAQGLMTAVSAAVSAASTTNPLIGKLWASEALPIKRSSSTLAALASAAGITSAQLDALFIAAAGVLE